MVRKKYKTIDNLNLKWGTDVWSEYYNFFNQIPQPSKNTPFIHNASLSTMYKLFHREKIVDFAEIQYKIIKQFSSKEVTTNTGLGFSLNNEILFSKLDCVGFDTYASNKMYSAFILNCDIWRNMKKEKDYWLLETACSYTGALDRYAEIHPSRYLIVEAFICYALGSKSFIYWLWRQQSSGSEISHSAVLNSWGTNSISYNDIILVEEMRKKIESIILNTEIDKAKVAITYSDISKAFFETESHKKNSYRNLITDFQKIILEMGIHRDWIPSNSSFNDYQVLITPFVFSLSEEYIEKAKKFVRNGGTWIIGPMTNIRTSEHTCHKDSGLGKKLELLAGIETLYFAPLENSDIKGEAFGYITELKLYSTIFKPTTSSIIGKIIRKDTTNEAFICENIYGKGKVISLGSLPDGDDGKYILKKLISNYVEKNRNIILEKDLIFVPRKNGKYNYYFIGNMTNEDKKIFINIDLYDVLQEKDISIGEYTIKSFEYIVFRREIINE